MKRLVEFFIVIGFALRLLVSSSWKRSMLFSTLFEYFGKRYLEIINLFPALTDLT